MYSRYVSPNGSVNAQFPLFRQNATLPELPPPLTGAFADALVNV